MDLQPTIDSLKELPEDRQRQVADLVEFLRIQVVGSHAPEKASGRIPLMEEPAVGMWKDREEMRDSAEWVRQLRQNEWNRVKTTP